MKLLFLVLSAMLVVGCGGSGTSVTNTTENGNDTANPDSGTNSSTNPDSTSPDNSDPNTPVTDTTGTDTTDTATTTPDTSAPDASGPDNSGPDNSGPDEQTSDASALTQRAVKLTSGTGAQLSGPLFSEVGRTKAQQLPDALAVVYEVVENHGTDAAENCKALGAEFASCSVANLHLKDSNASLNSGDWKLYFHSIRRILRVDSAEFDVFHVNGDLNYLTPSADFDGFSGDSIKTVKLITEFSHLHESDMMPRYWLVRDGQNAQLLANTDNESSIATYAVDITGDNRRAFNGEGNALATSTNRFERYATADTLTDVSALIIPTPANIATATGTHTIGGGFNFSGGVLSAATTAALTSRLNSFYSGGGAASSVSTAIDASLANNTYTLDIDDDGIAIRGADAQSVFYGAQSLLALVTPGSTTLPYLSITDTPRFEYRGMHLDVARNFHSVAEVKALIDQMAAYKLNKLHMHLTDDEGWRLQIPELPELTAIGGTRTFNTDADGNVVETGGLMPQLGSGPANSNQGTGFFTRAQFVDLLRYAQTRFVDVIPEFDMPGHARAAVVAMRVRALNAGNAADTNIRLDDPADTSRYLTIQHYHDGIINPCVPGTYNFMQTLVTSVASMYNDAGATLDVWHMGGDEAKSIFKGAGFQDASDSPKIPWKGDIDASLYDFPWEKSPACQALISSDATLSNLDDLTPYFIEQISDIVANAGIPALYAYQDILRNVDRDAIKTTEAGVGFWEVVWESGATSAYDYPNRGFDTIVAVPDYLYFDFPYEADPKERGYYWATRFTDTQKVFNFAPENLPQNAETSVNRDGNGWSATGSDNADPFIGMQGQLWSETVRTPEQFDYMIFPRLLALAERAWHTADWEIDYAPGVAYSSTSNRTDRQALADDWTRFANALGQKELFKLDAAGIQYRVAPAGAQTTNAGVIMNAEFPGLALEYSTDGNSWQSYNTATPPAAASFVRTLSANGSRQSRVTPVE